MEIAAQLKRGISRQFSTGSFRMNRKFSFKRQNSLDPRRNTLRFSFGRQSSMDPIQRTPQEELSVPGNLDSTMQLLFMACRGDAKGMQDLLDDGIDVNSIDLDGRTALHIAACEGHVEVAKLLLSRKANIDARDRWGSTVYTFSFFLCRVMHCYVLMPCLIATLKLMGLDRIGIVPNRACLVCLVLWTFCHLKSQYLVVVYDSIVISFGGVWIKFFHFS